MPSKPLTRILPLILLILPICGHAQLKDGRYFQVIASEQSINRTLWYQSGTKQQTITATRTARSGDYAYNAGKVITFFGDRIDTEGNPIPEAIAPVPEGASRLLLRFTLLPAPDKSGLSYSVVAIKDDTKNFPFGSFRFINASSTDVDVNLGDTKFLSKPGDSKNVRVEIEKSDVPIDITPIHTESKNSKYKYSNRWGHRANQRTLVFLVDAPNGRIKPLRYRQTEPTR